MCSDVCGLLAWCECVRACARVCVRACVKVASALVCAWVAAHVHMRWSDCMCALGCLCAACACMRVRASGARAQAPALRTHTVRFVPLDTHLPALGPLDAVIQRLFSSRLVFDVAVDVCVERRLKLRLDHFQSNGNLPLPSLGETAYDCRLQHVILVLVVVLPEEHDVVLGQRVQQCPLLRRAHQVRPLRIGGLLDGEDALVGARGGRGARRAQERGRKQRRQEQRAARGRCRQTSVCQCAARSRARACGAPGTRGALAPATPARQFLLETGLAAARGGLHRQGGQAAPGAVRRARRGEGPARRERKARHRGEGPARRERKARHHSDA